MPDDFDLPKEKILERFALAGRSALVTGGAQGIGRGFAHALAEAGADVAVVDLNLTAAQVVVEEILKRNPDRRAIAVKADITNPADVSKMVETVVAAFGDLTIACNNAGIGQWVDSESMSYEDFRKMMQINLDGVFLCAQAEAKYMLKKGYGKIINTASMSGHIANYPQNQAHYNASKAAVISLTQSLGTEWAKRGIRVNSISPGYTKTKLAIDLLETEIGKNMWPVWRDRIPQEKMAEVSDLQGAVVFLASSVSDYMTGADIVIDGGYIAW
jgi:NAD(P)-dependent dehydrogenase (short-subunit alcohol dehydrogenase family)